ncbi:trifunctional dihydropteroate synthetase [Tulasnella sp. 330]|nr:trifunctional dihydropteroate synthetase [Tulasnella sp. 330]
MTEARAKSKDWIIINSLSLTPTPLGSSLWDRPSVSSRPQPVTVSVAVPLASIRLAGASDGLANSVNYGTLAKTIERVVANRKEPFSCMEAMAEDVAAATFEEFSGVHEIQVVVAKPRALLHAKEAAVRITRKRGGDVVEHAEDRWDQILIRDLELSAIIGLNPWEREAKQVVRINLEMDVLTWKPSGSIPFDYKAVVWRVSKTVLDSSFLTVEALVTEIARVTFDMSSSASPHSITTAKGSSTVSGASIQRVTVRLGKPSALMFAESPEVQITRTPEDFQTSPLLAPTTKPKLLQHTVAISFGSNVGNRFMNIERALQSLEAHDAVKMVDTSFLYESDAMYVEDQRTFVNGACLITTSLGPQELLEHLKRVEVEVGRVPTFRNGPRVVDLDLIFYDDLVYDSRREETKTPMELMIPHVSMQERQFVLKPLNDIIPQFVHPSLNLTVSALYKDLLRQTAQSTTPSPSLRNVIPFHRRDPPPSFPMTPTEPEQEESQEAVPERYWTWGSKTHIMAIVNTTPDSFSDGGDHATVARAMEFIDTFSIPSTIGPPPSTSTPTTASRVDMIDVGGYSTRPGAAAISVEEEIARTVPLIKAIRASSSSNSNSLISIDTFRGRVASAAMRAGADVVNDVYGLTKDADVLKVVNEAGCPVIMMHSRGDAGKDKGYEEVGGVMDGVRAELGAKVKRALEAGLRRWNVIVDPGLGFSKSVEDNVIMVRRLDEFTASQPSSSSSSSSSSSPTRSLETCVMSVHPLAGMPVLIGASRKSFLGKVMGVEGDDAKGRVAATVAAHVAAIQRGADVIRVHDVREAWDSVKVADALWRK